MLVILLGVVFGLVFFYQGASSKRFRGITKKFWCAVLVVTFSVVLFLGTGLLVTTVLDFFVGFERAPIPLTEEKLIALNTAFGVEGSFFLGSGRIEGSFRYLYVIEDEKGYSVKTRRADNTYIKEGVDNPKLVLYQDRIKNEWLRKALPFLEETYAVFEVPEGAVVRDIEVSLGRVN